MYGSLYAETVVEPPLYVHVAADFFFTNEVAIGLAGGLHEYSVRIRFRVGPRG